MAIFPLRECFKGKSTKWKLSFLRPSLGSQVASNFAMFSLSGEGHSWPSLCCMGRGVGLHFLKGGVSEFVDF